MKFSDKHKQFAIKSYAHQNLQDHSQQISVNHNQHYSLVGAVFNRDLSDIVDASKNARLKYHITEVIS